MPLIKLTCVDGEPGAGGAQWLAEDVRTAAGLAGDLPRREPRDSRLGGVLRSYRTGRSTRS